MKHRVAVRTDRTQIFYRVDFMFLSDLRKKREVMNVGVAFAHNPVTSAKVEVADGASQGVAFR